MNSCITIKINTGGNCEYYSKNDDLVKETEVINQLPELTECLKKIDKPDSITFIGGEPGLWSYKLTGKLISIIDYVYGQDQHIQIDTNGLFMKKFPFLVNNKRFTFTYHITDPENYDLSKDPYIKLKNVTTTIVITKDLQNNYELLKKYKDECNWVNYEICDFPGKESTEIYKKYAFDKTQPTALTINNCISSIGNNSACYNKTIKITSNNIILYNCYYCYKSNILNVTSDFNFINKQYISLDQIVNGCKLCKQRLEGVI